MREASQSSSRSQQVRQRRQQTNTRSSNTKASRAAEHIRHPAQSAPPVVSRARTGSRLGNNTIHGVVGGTPLHQRNRGNVRKQYYYTLSTPGAEVRLPAMPNIHLGWRILSAVLVLVLGGALYGLWNSPQFQIGKAKVVGAQRLTWDDIDSVIHADGMPIFEVSPDEMQADLKQAFPDLKSVSVSASLPAKLVVTVQERVPLLAWKIGEKVLWVDKEGVAFAPRGEAGVDLVWVDAEAAPPAPSAPSAAADPASDSSSTADKNVSSNPADTQGAAASAEILPGKAVLFISPDLIQAILDMRAQVPDGSSVAYSPRYGLGWTDPKGWKVYFGVDVKDIDLKLKEYQVIVDQLAAKEIQPSLISVEFLQAPFYRVER